jgi:hypothetical protein
MELPLSPTRVVALNSQDYRSKFEEHRSNIENMFFKYEKPDGMG